MDKVQNIKLFLKGSALKHKKYGIIFIINIVIASIVYSLLMCNQLVNELDGLWHGSISYANGWELSIGRWLLRFLDKAHFYISPDPITSIFALTIFSAASILILDLFEINKLSIALLVSSLFMINTSICAILSFRFTSLAYAVSCFLGVFSAWLIICTPPRFSIVPVLTIALMMGCYQANIGCTCLLLLLYIPFRLNKQDMTIKELLQYLAKAAVTIILGGGLYYLLLNINLKYYDIEMNNYNGASGYGILGMITNLPNSFKHTYADFQFFFSNIGTKINIFSGKLYIIIFSILFAFLIYGLITLFIKNEINALISLLCFALVPAACNVALIIAYGSNTSIQMTLPMSLCIPALICVISKYELKESLLAYGAKLIAAGFLVLLLYGNFIMVQYDQQAMYMGRESMKTLTAEISDRLLQLDLFHPYYQYCFVGKPSANLLFNKNDIFLRSNDYARFGDFGVVPDCVRQSWYGFWTNEMGINLTMASDEKYKEIIATNELRQMPVFPEVGSCMMINDVVVIKVSDVFEE